MRVGWGQRSGIAKRFPPPLEVIGSQEAGRLVVSASESIGEKVRWALMRRLIEVLGEEEAETLMESLPPVVWQQIATKDDLLVLKDDLAALEERLMSAMDIRFAEFKSELAEFKSEVYGEFAALRVESAEFKSEVCGGFAALRVELADQRGEWKAELARNTRTTVLSFVGVAVAMLGAVVALAQSGLLAA